MGAIWRDPGLWIALGVTLLTLVVAVAMSRIFMRILKKPPPDVVQQLSKNEQHS
jgi:NhaP-type Na+/H+ or K+/H+ antiporter